MKRNMFVIVPVTILAFVAVCVGVVFAAAYISPTPIKEEFVPAEELDVVLPIGGEKTLTLQKVSESADGDPESALLDYVDENRDIYFFRGDELTGGLRLSLNNPYVSTGEYVTMEEAQKIAMDFLSDREDLYKYTPQEGYVNNSENYEFNFFRECGEFTINGSYSVEILKNGEIYSWSYAPSSTSEFDESLLDGITMDDVLAYCDREIEDECEFYRCIVQKYNGKYVIRCAFLKNMNTPYEERISVNYPLE